MFLETDKSELDMLIKVQLFHHRNNLPRNTSQRKGKGSLDQDGFSTRIHGNKGESPKHALTMEDVKRVKQFLLSYANKYGLPYLAGYQISEMRKLFYCPLTKPKQKFTLADEMSLRKIIMFISIQNSMA
uniref:Uncharacterized protein n=1 Tax=Magallana gigas TaxID=29159 RepID=A0A8W8MJ60_MAGGI